MRDRVGTKTPENAQFHVSFENLLHQYEVD